MPRPQVLCVLLGVMVLRGVACDGGSSEDTCDTPPEMYRSVANSTCLVTGISGMIGSYIAREVCCVWGGGMQRHVHHQVPLTTSS
jgi:hypothetical protein